MNWPTDTATTEITGGSRARLTSAKKTSSLGFSLSLEKSKPTEVIVDSDQFPCSVMYILSVDDPNVLSQNVRGAVLSLGLF